MNGVVIYYVHNSTDKVLIIRAYNANGAPYYPEIKISTDNGTTWGTNYSDSGIHGGAAGAQSIMGCVYDAFRSKWFVANRVAANNNVAIYSSTTAASGSWSLVATITAATHGGIGPSISVGKSTSLTFDPITHNLLLTIAGGTPVSNNWYSTDGGVSWAASTGAGNYGVGDIRQWINPVTGTAITVNTDTSYDHQYWRSTDGGVSYTNITYAEAGVTGESVVMTPGPNSDWFLFLNAPGTAFYRSTDDGLTWTSVTADLTLPFDAATTCHYNGVHLMGVISGLADPYSCAYGIASTPTTFFLPYMDTPTNINSVWNMYVKVL
jgi:hypothetical protein